MTISGNFLLDRFVPNCNICVVNMDKTLFRCITHTLTVFLLLNALVYSCYQRILVNREDTVYTVILKTLAISLIPKQISFALISHVRPDPTIISRSFSRRPAFLPVTGCTFVHSTCKDGRQYQGESPPSGPVPNC